MYPLVSILIPAYNAEKFITETLKSAVNQTYDNCEIIVIDDGSKDKTYEVAKRFSSKKVKVLRQDNEGACRTRNSLMQFAQGNYFQFLDADDVLHKEKIDAQMKFAQTDESQDFFFTAAFGTFFNDINKAKFRPNSLWQDLKPIEWILNKFNDSVWMNPTCWLIPRKLAELGGEWEHKITRSGDDDGEYMCRVIKNANMVKFVESAKCYYRIGNIGSLNWGSKKALDELYLSLRLTTEHLLFLEDSERTRKACLQYLQAWFEYFEGSDGSAKNKMLEYAKSLGGELSMPELKLKYYPIKFIFGENIATHVKNYLPMLKLKLKRKLEPWSI